MLFESSLIKKAQKGNKKSLETLYTEHFKSLYIFVRHKVDTNERAEDITAEAFMKAFEKLDTFKGNSCFKSWLYTIAKNLVYDWYKSKERDAVVEDDVLENVFGEEEDEEGKLQDKELRITREEEVKNVLRTLKANYREVLELRFLLNYSLKETADAMGTTVGNVKVLQNRAIKKAREVAKADVSRNINRDWDLETGD